MKMLEQVSRLDNSPKLRLVFSVLWWRTQSKWNLSRAKSEDTDEDPTSLSDKINSSTHVNLNVSDMYLKCTDGGGSRP